MDIGHAPYIYIYIYIYIYTYVYVCIYHHDIYRHYYGKM